MSDYATLWTVAHQAPLSTGFSRQEHWRGLPFPLRNYQINISLVTLGKPFSLSVEWLQLEAEIQTNYRRILIRPPGTTDSDPRKVIPSHSHSPFNCKIGMIMCTF